MVATLQEDVEFYTFVHHLGGGSDSTRERRVAERRPYVCRQWVAPIARDETPADECYESIQCRDISTSGFSFFSPAVPARERLSVRLGMPGSWLYLAARIARCAEVDTPEGPAVLVGCQFMSRE